MTLDFDPSADFAEATDNTEPVTLLRRGSTPGTPGVVIAHALRGAATQREAVLRNPNNMWRQIHSDGRLTAGAVMWHLPTEELGDSPRLGDVVLDGDGHRWTVLLVQLATLRTRWRCLCRDLVIAHALDDTINILKATYVKGECGAAEPTWRTCRTGLRARIQPDGTKATTEHEAYRTVARYKIFLEEDFVLDHNDCIQGPDGTLYRVVKTLGAERIGELQTVDVERLP